MILLKTSFWHTLYEIFIEWPWHCITEDTWNTIILIISLYVINKIGKSMHKSMGNSKPFWCRRWF